MEELEEREKQLLERMRGTSLHLTACRASIQVHLALQKLSRIEDEEDTAFNHDSIRV